MHGRDQRPVGLSRSPGGTVLGLRVRPLNPRDSSPMFSPWGFHGSRGDGSPVLSWGCSSTVMASPVGGGLSPPRGGRVLGPDAIHGWPSPEAWEPGGGPGVSAAQPCWVETQRGVLRPRRSFQEMKADEADAFSVGPEKEANSTGEAMISLPPKKRHSMALLPRKQEGQRECPLEASVKVKGEGSTVSHKAHGKTLEKGHSPPEGSSSKCVPRKHKNGARGSAPPKPPNSLSDGSDGVSGAGLLLKPVGKLLGRPRGSDHSTRDRNGKARPALGVEPNLLPPIPEEIEDDVKYKLRKEVRRFGRKYEKIFQLLEEVEGPPEVRKELVEFTIKEAARIKRRDLIQHLEKMLEKFHIPPNENN